MHVNFLLHMPRCSVFFVFFSRNCHQLFYHRSQVFTFHLWQPLLHLCPYTHQYPYAHQYPCHCLHTQVRNPHNLPCFSTTHVYNYRYFFAKATSHFATYMHVHVKACLLTSYGSTVSTIIIKSFVAISKIILKSYVAVSKIILKSHVANILSSKSLESHM